MLGIVSISCVSSTLARVLLTTFPESAEHDALFYDPITKAEA